VYKFNRAIAFADLSCTMTEFMIPLAKNYDGVNIMNDIYIRLYPEQADEKTNRFDPVFAHTVMYLLNYSNRYGNYICIIRVPIILRDLCTIASDGGLMGGEKIYLMPSKVPIIRHPVIMSHNDVREFVNALDITQCTQITDPKISKTTDAPITSGFNRLVRAHMSLAINIPNPDMPCPTMLRAPPSTPINDTSLFAMYED
jgi:hypothetical protein